MKIVEALDNTSLIKAESKFSYKKEYTDPVLLFLDFDGVLHSLFAEYENTGLFCKAHYIDTLLRERPNVAVIISSSWAKNHTLEELRAPFSVDVRNRIVGSITNQSSNRHDDVIRYIEENDYSYPWIAVDDIALYHTDDPVVWSDWRTGLTSKTYLALKNAVSSPIEYAEFCKKKF